VNNLPRVVTRRPRPNRKANRRPVDCKYSDGDPAASPPIRRVLHTQNMAAGCDVVTATVTSALRHAGKLTSAQKRALRHVLARPHKHKDRRGRRPGRQATVVDTNSLLQPSQQLDGRNGTGR